MAKVTVEAGVCGFVTEILAKQNSNRKVDMEIQSTCPHVQSLAEDYKETEGMKEVFAPYGESELFKKSKQHIKHAACPVPTAIMKAIEVSCGLALPSNVHMHIYRENE